MSDSGGGIIVIFVLLFSLLFLGIILFSYWKLFEKMGEPGWKGIIPIINMVTIAERVGKPAYWGVLTLIPYIGIIWGIWFKRFGKTEAYTVLTLFFGIITIPMLAFGPDKWQEIPNENQITHR